MARAAGARVRGDGHVPWTVGRGWWLLLSQPSTTTITKQDMIVYRHGLFMILLVKLWFNDGFIMVFDG